MIFGMMKSLLDAHTMGVYAAAGLLNDSGYIVHIAPKEIEAAVDKIDSQEAQDRIVNWVICNKIDAVSISYRLDPTDAVLMVGKIIHLFREHGLYGTVGAQVKQISFAGLTEACLRIEGEYGGRITTFRGGETSEETLIKMGVSPEKIPESIRTGCKYDKELTQWGKNLLKTDAYKHVKPLTPNLYPEYGTLKDTLGKRLAYNFKEGFHPLIRAHSGPYSPKMTRSKCVNQYIEWCRQLSTAGYLDILSIGSSQLSQSHFGEDWSNRKNGGGVPVNSEEEYARIRDAASPMLVRTYSATNHVREMAEMYERSLNISWHALSLWWFNQIDGRGPLSLYENLKQHIDTVKYIAQTGKPLETNIPHHFAFRGCDDLSYIVSAYIGAKLSKLCGIKIFILQNMLNTPRSTWGVQDIAKSRAMLKLVKSLEDDSFKVILQTRAGLDYFKPNLDEAKSQLASVTAMMDDIDPYNLYSPEIIHVVSYSEALFLATPKILNESIQITRYALEEYRKARKSGFSIQPNEEEIQKRMNFLYDDSLKIIQEMENQIMNLYSPEGLYLAFVSGWFPVPELWEESDEFLYAKKWITGNRNGGKWIFQGKIIMPVEQKIDICSSNLSEARYILKSKYGRT